MKFLSCLFYFFLVFEPICFAQKATFDILVSEPSKPGIPTNIVVNSLDGRNLRISWNGISANGYELAYKLKSANEWTTVRTSKNASEINTSNLGGIYQIKVRNLDPKSSGLDFSDITEYLKPPICPKVANLKWYFNSLTSIGLTWDPVFVNVTEMSYVITRTNLSTNVTVSIISTTSSISIPYDKSERGYKIEVKTKCSDGLFSESSFIECGTQQCNLDFDTNSLNNRNLVNFFGFSEYINSNEVLLSDPHEIYDRIEKPSDIDRFNFRMPYISQKASDEIFEHFVSVPSMTAFEIEAEVRHYCATNLPKGRLVITLDELTKDYDIYLRDIFSNEVLAKGTRNGTESEIIEFFRPYYDAYYYGKEEVGFVEMLSASNSRNTFAVEVVPKDPNIDYDSTNCYNLTVNYLPEGWREYTCNLFSIFLNKKATNSTISLDWNRVIFADSYIVEYKKDIDDGLNWKTLNTTQNSVLLTGLSSGTKYIIRIKIVMNTEAISGDCSFEYFNIKTTGACVDVNEPNNTPQQATWLGVNNELFGSIGSSSDQDFFQFPSPGKTIHLSLENLPADYDLYLHDQAGNYLAWSTNTGLNSESITYTNNNYYGMYSVRVQNRIAGQYDPNECYKLKYWTSQNRLMDPNTNAVNEMNISLYPNPNNGHFVVNYTALVTKNTTVNIFDIYGKLVNSTDFTLNEGQNTLELNLDNLSNGIYFLSATDEPLQRQKFIISK